MESVIAFENVSKIYPLYHHITGSIKNFFFHLPKSLESIKNSKYEALHDISFTVSRGEALGIIGRNGAGKSTILGLIAGVLKPTTGKITVNGRISPLLELGAGFHFELTGRENILLNGILLGLSRTDVLKRIDEIIAFSELEDFIDQPIRVYSSGMIARLGFSVVAHLDPEILLIDEILSVGDAEFQKKCIDKMMSFKKNGVTIVFVSHAADSIRQICNKVIWFEDHKVRMQGDVETILQEYSNRG